MGAMIALFAMAGVMGAVIPGLLLANKRKRDGGNKPK